MNKQLIIKQDMTKQKSTTEARRFKTIECHTCGDRHESSRMTSLEFSNTDGKYYNGIPAGHESQGWFNLCPDCAESATRHIEEAAERAKKLAKISEIKRQLGWSNKDLAEALNSTTQNINNALAPSSKQALPKWAEALVFLYEGLGRLDQARAAMRLDDTGNDHLS